MIGHAEVRSHPQERPRRRAAEGSAGIVAADLDAVVRLVVGVLTWQDVVSDAPYVDAMRASFESLLLNENGDEYDPL
jgi:hypothetical protein